MLSGAVVPLVVVTVVVVVLVMGFKGFTGGSTDLFKPCRMLLCGTFISVVAPSNSTKLAPEAFLTGGFRPAWHVFVKPVSTRAILNGARAARPRASIPE